MATNLHKEEQRFNDKVVMALLGAGIVSSLYAAVNTLLTNPVNAIKAGVLLLVALALGGWLYWLVTLRLKVKISNKSIKYQMAPFHTSNRKIKWKEVEDCTIVKTPAIAQWNGWNLNYGTESRFSLSGRNGLSVTTKDGRKYFIGCRDVDGLQEAMQSFSVG
jgi:hypothetical protein